MISRSHVAALLSAMSLCAVAICSASATARDLRIQHVTVVSPEHPLPLENMTVTIRGERIVGITTSDVTTEGNAIDGRGLFLSPGLIDSHVHLGAIPGMAVPGMTAAQERAHPAIARAMRAQSPRSFLYFGFTTLVDLISTPQAMAVWNAHPVHPDTYFCGAAALMDGYPMQAQPMPDRYRIFPYFIIEPGAVAPAGVDPSEHTPEAVVARMKRDGAICVKTFFERGYGANRNLPVPKLATIQSVVRAAHAAGLPVLMHANSTEAQQFALSAGVDIIAHGLWNWSEPLSSTALAPDVRETLDGVVSSRVGWQPTVQVLYGLRELFDPAFLKNPLLDRVLPEQLIGWYRTSEGQWFRREVEADTTRAPAGSEESRRIALSVYSSIIVRDEISLRYLNRHHARILFGTDTPSAPTYANPPGLNGWLEMHRLVDAGMTPAEIFRAATIANARALRLRDVGTVEVGKRANLLLMREDPTKTIKAYDEIVKVIVGGRVLDRNALAANAVEAERSP